MDGGTNPSFVILPISGHPGFRHSLQGHTGSPGSLDSTYFLFDRLLFNLIGNPMMLCGFPVIDGGNIDFGMTCSLVKVKRQGTLLLDNHAPQIGLSANPKPVMKLKDLIFYRNNFHYDRHLNKIVVRWNAIEGIIKTQY